MYNHCIIVYYDNHSITEAYTLQDLRQSMVVKKPISGVNCTLNLIFTNNVKIHVCDVKNSRLGHNLPASVNDSDVNVSRGFIFAKLRECEVSGI